MCPAAADGIFYCAPNTNAGLVLNAFKSLT